MVWATRNSGFCYGHERERERERVSFILCVSPLTALELVWPTTRRVPALKQLTWSYPHSGEIKKARNYSSTSLYAFLIYSLNKCRRNFNFTVAPLCVSLSLLLFPASWRVFFRVSPPSTLLVFSLFHFIFSILNVISFSFISFPCLILYTILTWSLFFPNLFKLRFYPFLLSFVTPFYSVHLSYVVRPYVNSEEVDQIRTPNIK